MSYKFSKLDNFRDLGGFAAAGGKLTAYGRLLRSGELSNLTTEDIRILREDYQTVNIVDLRTANERWISPDCEIPKTRYLTFDFFPGEAADKAECSEKQLARIQNKEQQHRNMLETYVSFITEESACSAINDVLTLLLETGSGATLFHCYAGKDRTGITAAVILTVLGVSKGDIMRDYIETNVMRSEANHTILEYLKKEGRPEAVLEAIRVGLCVEPEYLETAYRTANKTYGSFENYITQGIGFKKADWERLRTMYLG